MAEVFYRYREEGGAWVVTDRLEAVPEAQRDAAERIELPPLRTPEATPEAGNPASETERTAPSGGWADWVQAARDAVPDVAPPSVPVPDGPPRGFDLPSFGIGLGLGLTVFVVYAFLRSRGRWLTRLALVALVVALVGTSLAGMWIAPHVPGAPEWLMTPDELFREAQRVADEAAPENRLGDLE